MDSKVCVTCHNNKPVNSTDNRLVTENCGHIKCMDCLLREKSGCVACVDETNNKISEASAAAVSLDTSDTSEILTDEEKSIRNDMAVVVSTEFSIRKKRETSHITVETDAKGTTVYVCKCDRRFYSANQIPYHSYCNGTQKPYHCSECNKSFVSASHYQYHMRVHRDERTYVCEICNESFFQMSKLQRHKLKHTKEKRFSCKDCMKPFNNMTALRKHNLTHTKDRPYSCSICSASFRDPSNHRKHLMRHAIAGKKCTCAVCGAGGEAHRRAPRPHPCTHCTRSFHSRKDLRRHQQVHTDSKPFRCKECSRRFRRKDNLERHIRNTHPDLAPASAVACDDIPAPPSPPAMPDYDIAEKTKLKILNPLPPLPEEVIQKHMKPKTEPEEPQNTVTAVECTPDNSYIIEANTARQSVIVTKTTERKIPSPVEYVHKIRKAKSMRGQKDILLPPIDEGKLVHLLGNDSDLNRELSTPHPKNIHIYKNILGLAGAEREKEEEARVHWRKKKLNIN